MRLLLLVATLAAAVAVAVWLVGRAEAPSPTAGRTGSVTLVGDSLNVGIERYLPEALPGWTIRNRNLVGRATPEGIDVLRGEGDALNPVVVVSLGTNDGPDDPAGFRREVREALAIAGPARCVVWVNLAVDDESFDALNGVLETEAGRTDTMRVVDWAGLIEEHPEWLSADGVHATETGYAERADAVADAVRSCPAPAERSRP
jgi:hypothetical protein